MYIPVQLTLQMIEVKIIQIPDFLTILQRTVPVPLLT